MIGLLGALGFLLSFTLWLPQARRIWQTRHDAAAMRVVSLATYAMVLVNAIVWAAYGFLTGAFWAGAPGLANGPLAVMVIVLTLRARAQHARRNPACPCGWTSTSPHDFVVTAPPGWGTVHSPCRGAVTQGFAVPFGEGQSARQGLVRS